MKHNQSETDDNSTVVNMEPKPVSKTIYALPNLITTAGLFAGFYAIMQAWAGHYEAACIAVYIAMVMDILDGRLARLTNTMSEFGTQYDSLADMVSFGLAPALVIHQWVLHDLGKVGSLVTFVYIACTALRLARFNVIKTTEKRYFIGLASPAAAGLVISAMYVAVDYQVATTTMAPVLCVLVFLSAILMVSNLRYRSFKDFDVKDRMPFVGMIIVVLVFAAIYFDPPVAFLLVGSSYFLSGLLGYVWHNYIRKQKQAE